MKKVLFVLAAAACMVACNKPAAQEEAPAADSVVVAEEVAEVGDSAAVEVADSAAVAEVAE